MWQKNYNTIFFIGPMASGKSTLGKLIAEYLNVDFFDLDSEIEKNCNKKIVDIFDIYGEQYFRTVETKTLLKILNLPQKKIISTGGGIVLKKNNRKFLKKGYIVELKVCFEEQMKRLQNDKVRPLFLKKNLKSINQIRKELYNLISDFKLISNKDSFFNLKKHLDRLLFY